MTIICATLGQEWIAVASDSYRTSRKDDDTLEVLDEQSTKIVAVRNNKFHGAISWCGYCGEKNDGSDDILLWFSEHASPNDDISAEEFANALTKDLNLFYEKYSERWKLPLRYIHNVDGNYAHSGSKVICQRHSRFHALPATTAPIETHHQLEHRKTVHEFLKGHDLMFNNPNPKVAAPIQALVQKGLERDGITGPAWYLQVTRDPILYAVHILRHGSSEKTRIGGAVHSLLISRNGQFSQQDPIQPS
jgi:hypothetical protein